MKNKLLTIALTAACCLTYIACDDNKDEFLDEFSTILSFRNCDEIEVEVYNTGENGEYQLIVNKSGAQLGTVTRASIDVMDKALLEIYNEQNGKDYQLYPEDCYVFNGDKQIEFGPNDTYQTRSVTLITDKILESNQQEGNFVIPFILQNSADSINAERKYVFLKPAVIVPNVAFEKTGYNLNIISDAMDANEIELNLPAVFSVDNKWNFSCTLEPDESLLTEYNEKNGVDYTMLSEEAYTLSNEGKILFTAGSKSASLTVTVKRNKLSYGNYVLPLKMTQCSSPYFEINPNKQSCLFGISYVPDESKLILGNSLYLLRISEKETARIYCSTIFIIYPNLKANTPPFQNTFSFIRYSAVATFGFSVNRLTEKIPPFSFNSSGTTYPYLADG